MLTNSKVVGSAQKGIKRLGLITGTGDLPVILANGAKANGIEVISIAFSKESAAALNLHLKKFTISV